MSLASEPEVPKRILEAGQGEISLSFLGKLDHPVMRLAAEGVGEGHLAQRLRTGFRDFLVAVAERGAPQAGHALDIALARVVIEIDPAALIEDQGPHLAVAREIGIGVDHRLDVADGHVGQGHVSFPS
jgi:hypothetical protein